MRRCRRVEDGLAVVSGRQGVRLYSFYRVAIAPSQDERASITRNRAGGGTADGTRRSTVGTLNMGKCARTGNVLAWVIDRDVLFTSPSHGSNSGARVGPYSMHT